MTLFAKYFSLITASFICVLSSIAFATNYFVSKFPGNDYFPPGMTIIATILFLTLFGAYLLFDKNSPYLQITRELNYFFLVITVLGFATNAVQYTPFNPIDRQLIAIDSALHINLPKVVAWTANKPWLKKMLAISYDSLSYQMCYLPLILITTRRFLYIREYYALLLITCLIGFSIYYFLPTMGPASFIASPYFIEQQYATGIKFTELRHHIPPSTLDGGMIGMPSFHTIWAWLCLYLVRGWPIVFVLLLPVNLLLTTSCVLLGWHYLIDLFGSLILLLLAHTIYFYSVKRYPLTDEF